jgi:high affinity sulfate transporter 1
MSSVTGEAAAKRRRFPVKLFEGLLPVDRAGVPKEVIAGVTLAALAIPEVMGYTKIAGMPVITGLYTILVPLALFAVLGSSRHLVVGADSATAAIMFAELTPLAAAGSPQYVALAGMLALMAGAFLLLARILRLGFLADFLSRTVLIGFLTGVGIQVACGQLASMFGYAKVGRGPALQVYNWARDLGQTSLTTLAISAAVLLVIIVGGRLAPKIPWALVAVLGAIAASAALDLSAHGVKTLGAIPGGLPHLTWPAIPAGDYAAIAGTAVSVFVVILAQSAATSRAYAAKFNEDFDENTDLVGLGLANLGAGFTGTFVVNGSPTKTAMVESAGGRSQLAQLTTAAIVLVVLLFLTKPLSFMPEAVLAAVVFLIGVKLVDLRGMRKVFRSRRLEFVVAAVTTAAVVFVGVEQGIIVAIVLSVVIHLRHSYRPSDQLLVQSPSGRWLGKPLASGAQAAPGLAMYRFGASLYYANASRLAEETRAVRKNAQPPLEWLCLVAEAVIDVDYTASAMLRAGIERLQRHGITTVLCEVPDAVKAELDKDGLTELIGADNFYGDTDDVLEAYLNRGKDPGPANGKDV